MSVRWNVPNKQNSCINVLHFLLQDMRCCLDLQYVERVLPLPLLETIPKSPAYFAGLMNFQSKCIPVIDLGICAGLVREQAYSLNMPILLCSDGIHRIGFLVDKMIGLDEIDKDKIEIHEEFNHSSSIFYGAITLDTGVSLLMDVSGLFALRLTQEMPLFSADHD